ncbi:Uncharacterised protein [Citrobacter koseri]|nr:Uncharacterised protein [Citrobacter koseri]
MQHLKNLKNILQMMKIACFLMNEHGAEFFISDDGRDWYKSQSDFLPNTLKVAYDEAELFVVSVMMCQLFIREILASWKSKPRQKIKWRIFQGNGYLKMEKSSRASIRRES